MRRKENYKCRLICIVSITLSAGFLKTYPTVYILICWILYILWNHILIYSTLRFRKPNLPQNYPRNTFPKLCKNYYRQL